MKTKGTKKNKVNIVTLGCSKNLVDSENIFTQLKGNGYNVSHESQKDDASIVIVNTCGFIDNAKQESIDTILRYADAKEAGLVDKVYVTGCLSHRYKDELAVEIPTVDAWFGTNELPRLLKTLKADYKQELVGERLLTTPAHYAYLKIAEGCDRPCSFCAIPLMRGGHVSRTIDDLVIEAKSLARRGTKELILIAQDLTYYGLDIYKKRNLSELLNHLSDVEGIEWIRLQYAYPSGFPMDVLDVMRERSNICKYLDMPLQSGSSEMLKIMRRGITREKTEDLIKTIRDKVPDIALRTTLKWKFGDFCPQTRGFSLVVKKSAINRVKIILQRYIPPYRPPKPSAPQGHDIVFFSFFFGINIQRKAAILGQFSHLFL